VPAVAPSGPVAGSSARKLGLQAPAGKAEVDRRIEETQKALGLLPDKVDRWILLGRLWVRKARETADPGYYTNAGACADVVQQIEPGNRLARGLEAQVRLNEHEFVKAMDLADQALARAPDDLVALGVKSDACLELGRIDEAAKAAQRMVDIKPNLPAYTRASYLKWLVGGNDEAKRIARLAIDAGIDPHDPEPGAWAIVQSAMIFWSEGDYGGADAGFDLALKRMSDFPPALAGKGRAALARGDAKKAVELLAKAYEESPLVETAWALGDARAAAGDAEGAAKAYAEVEKRGRQSDHRSLALFFAVKNRNIDEAVRLAEGEKKVRGDVVTEDALAWAYYRAGRFKDAKEASDRATRLGTRDAQLWFHAGAINIALGDKVAGVKQIKEALKLSPKFDPTGAEEAATMVAAAEKK
jgi:tetratricopeptide (TPR) repeat protein